MQLNQCPREMSMAESGSGKSQVDIESLKETLCSQQRLLQKLYNELDAEREASSTAASEALSMILRLQGEKAAMKMDLEQYKRLSEEKMNHAEESLAIFEDIMYQKEMEVASMDYQVQAYRYKLLSMGCADPGIGEIKFPDTLLQRNETLGGEINLESLGRRNSAPPLALKYAKKGGVFEKDNSLSPETYRISEDCSDQDNINDPTSDTEKKTDSSLTGCLNSYWEEIKKLDGRVKEISGISYVNLRASTRSSSPQLSSDSSYDLPKGSIVNEVDIVKHPPSEKMAESSGCSPNVLDVFEVPSVDYNVDDDASQSQQTKHLEKIQYHPSCFPEENLQSCVKDDGSDMLKKIISSSIHHRPKIQCNMAFIRPESSVSEILQRLHLNQSSEIVEVENQSVGQESHQNREEELRLLNEIREQLNSIQSQIRCLKPKEHEQRDELSLAMLSEEMLHFWL